MAYADSIKDTNTVGELVGLPLVIAIPATNYSGPLFVSYNGPVWLNTLLKTYQFPNGEYDALVYGGYCPGAYNVEAMKSALYPNAKNVQVQIQPGSDHGLTLHTNATGHIKVIMDYLNDNGL